MSEKISKPLSEQINEILVTRSGLFKASQLAWHPKCKEEYPPVGGREFDSQFLEDKYPFIVLGDHLNIIYVMYKKKATADVS